MTINIVTFSSVYKTQENATSNVPNTNNLFYGPINNLLMEYHFTKWKPISTLIFFMNIFFSFFFSEMGKKIRANIWSHLMCIIIIKYKHAKDVLFKTIIF